MHKILFDDLWYWYLTGEHKEGFPRWAETVAKISRGFYGMFPGDPRCMECNVPMSGPGSLLFRPGSRPSSFSPHLCSSCESSARREEGGAEVELTMLFADVRNSTPLAEAIGISQFRNIMQRFFKDTSGVLIAHNAMVNRFIGDQVSALFVPRFAGQDHPKVALYAASELLRVTGHADPNGPWIPVGVGVHTGIAYVGAVGSKKGVNEISVLGSAANLTARLSSSAATGEILISEESATRANLEESLERRSLELKGISGKVPVRVIKLST
jgi:adenylate cyclase